MNIIIIVPLTSCKFFFFFFFQNINVHCDTKQTTKLCLHILVHFNVRSMRHQKYTKEQTYRIQGGKLSNYLSQRGVLTANKMLLLHII